MSAGNTTELSSYQRRKKSVAKSNQTGSKCITRVHSILERKKRRRFVYLHVLKHCDLLNNNLIIKKESQIQRKLEKNGRFFTRNCIARGAAGNVFNYLLKLNLFSCVKCRVSIVSMYVLRARCHGRIDCQFGKIYI